MSYVATIHLVPPAIGADEVSLNRIVSNVVDTFSTIAYSLDDAISLVNGGLSGSKIIAWNANLLSFEDQSRLEHSGVEIEWRNLPSLEPRVNDIIASLPSTGGYTRRELDDIYFLTIHHSVGWDYDASNQENAERIANYHFHTKDWPGVGYHYLLCPDGEILQINELETVSYHVGTERAPGNENFPAIGICLGGDFRLHLPTQAQVYAASALCDYLKSELTNSIAVLPHKRMPGAATICPGKIDLEAWLRTIDGSDIWA